MRNIKQWLMAMRQTPTLRASMNDGNIQVKQLFGKFWHFHLTGWVKTHNLAKAIVLASLFTFGTAAFATTYIVSNTKDAGIGSLRDAIIAANGNSGPDSIVFSIPDMNADLTVNECAVQDGGRICTIHPLTALPDIIDTISIDGSIPESRAGIPGSVKKPLKNATLRPGIEISGDLSPSGNGISLKNSNGHFIRGLILNRWRNPATGAPPRTRDGLYGENISNSVFEGNYIGTDASGRLGNSLTVANYGNTGLGMGINQVAQGTGIRIGGIGNNQRNIFSNNGTATAGVGVVLYGSSDSQILGNFCGTDVTGEKALGNGAEGVDLRNDIQNRGSITANIRIEYNLAVASKARSGFRLLGRSPTDPVVNTVFVNNISGLSLLTHTPLPNFQGGLSIADQVTNSRVGFDVVNDHIVPMPNTFADNSLFGVALNSSPAGTGSLGPFARGVPTNNALLFNKIYGNVSGLAIDLSGDNVFAGDGVTPNRPVTLADIDPSNPNATANHYQNFPLLTEAKKLRFSPILAVKGSLNSLPNTYFIVQFFANDTAKAKTVEVVLGNGPQPVILAQAKSYLGSWIVKTDANGNSNFIALTLGLPARLPACSIDAGTPGKSCITATATRLDVDVLDLNKHGCDDDLNVNYTDTSEVSPAVVLK